MKYTRKDGKTIVSFSNWKDIFFHMRFAQNIEEGSMHPRGYLPVSFNYMNRGYTVWILPLAPFVLLIKASTLALREFWMVLVQVTDKWNKI